MRCNSAIVNIVHNFTGNGGKATSPLYIEHPGTNGSDTGYHHAIPYLSPTHP